jgi:hypothetical protein
MNLLQITTIAAATALANFHHFSTASRAAMEAGRLSPLWAKEFSELPLFITSLCAALAVLLLASIRAYVAWGRTLMPELLERIRMTLVMLLIFSLGVRGSSLGQEEMGQLSLNPHLFPLLFVEVGALVSSLLFLCRPAGRSRPASLYAGAAAVLIWLVPPLTDVLLAFAILGIGIAGFAAMSRYLDVFPEIRREFSV